MERPQAVTVFGILNIIFAVLGVVGMIGTLAMFSVSANSDNPIIKVMRESPGYATWMKFTIPIGIITCMLLAAAGIGLLRLKPWGRKLSIGYAIYAIVFTTISTAINFLFLFRPLIEEAQQRQGPEAAGAIGGAVGASFGGCFGLIYPIILLIFMMRPKIVAAFRAPVPPPSIPAS